jgi:D-alanyl-D-alanine carboxypeptidase
VTFKPSDALRFLGGLGIAALVLAFVALRVTSCAPAPPAHLPAQTGPVSPSLPPFPSSPSPPPTLPPASSAACEDGPAAAARANAASLGSLAWSPFGRAEAGWETYAPLIAREIATACGPATPGFAAALAAWQDRQRLAADGIMSAAVFARLKGIVQMRRPFVRLSAQGACPAPPAESTLAWARPAEGYSNKPLQLRPGALAAYRALAAAARAEDPRIAADPRNLTIFSGYRSPAVDAVRCATEHNCNGTVRATCSAHRTGLAMDLYVGQAPGYGPDSSADLNRRYMSRTPAYRWLVGNAARFGFAPYPFEPWHWEWTGEAP